LDTGLYVRGAILTSDTSRPMNTARAFQ